MAGARFAEWRANIDPMTVPRGQVHVDVVALARGAAGDRRLLSPRYWRDRTDDGEVDAGAGSSADQA